jgi:preprotein translocase subunit SecG
MQTVLVIAELIIAIALVIFVLLQRSEGGGLGMGTGGGGGMGGLFSARGAADALTRTTAVLATLFFLICIGLNLLARQGSTQKSILETVPITSTTKAPAPVKSPLNSTPFAPSVPKPQ